MYTFSFGEKVGCKVELHRDDPFHYGGNAIVSYPANTNGQRVCPFFFFLFFFLFFLFSFLVFVLLSFLLSFALSFVLSFLLSFPLSFPFFFFNIKQCAFYALRFNETFIGKVKIKVEKFFKNITQQKSIKEFGFLKYVLL
jgi:hypothetical protein